MPLKRPASMLPLGVTTSQQPSACACRKIPPTRINRPVPEWARRLLAGELPERDSEAEYAYVAWLYFGDEVPGLPLADSPEGSKLWYEATHAGQAS